MRIPFCRDFGGGLLICLWVLVIFLLLLGTTVLTCGGFFSSGCKASTISLGIWISLIIVGPVIIILSPMH